jgi:hypothetical protein
MTSKNCKRRGKVEIVLLCALAAILIVLGIFAFAGRNRLTSGTIIDKKHVNPSSHVTVNPIVGGNGGFTVGSEADAERWLVVVEGNHEGERRIETHDMDRYEWEAAKIGDRWHAK